MKGTIGIFDSGFGGLTVMRQILNLLPYEDIIYFGDTAHLPYGTKSKRVITSFSRSIVEFLLTKQVKMIVIACNTASAYSLQTLKKEIDLPIVGVIEPGARGAVKATRNNRIGIIGTEATVGTKTYENAIKKIDKRVKVFSRACPLLAPLVEEGWLTHPITKKIACEYLEPLKKAQIDSLILGCTHYPLLKRVLSDIMGKKVTLIDSSVEIAKTVKHMLIAHGLDRRPSKKISRKVTFYVSDNPTKFARLGKMFLAYTKELTNIKYVEIDR